jgi:hypothetical protein
MTPRVLAHFSFMTSHFGWPTLTNFVNNHNKNNHNNNIMTMSTKIHSNIPPDSSNIHGPLPFFTSPTVGEAIAVYRPPQVHHIVRVCLASDYISNCLILYSSRHIAKYAHGKFNKVRQLSAMMPVVFSSSHHDHWYH